MLLAAVLATLLGLGCSDPEPMARLEACRDADCQLEAVMDAWDADTEACWALVTSIGDEMTRAALVATIAAHRPGVLEGRCDDLPRGGSRKRCTRLTRRPHLRQGRKLGHQPTKLAARQAPGPTSGALSLPTSPAEVTPGDCGDLSASECAFLGAERTVLGGGLPALDEALGLCALSDHGPDCVEHVLELAIPGVPPADAVSHQQLDQAVAAAEHFRAAAGSEVVASLYEGWFWSVWTATAFAKAGTLRGELLDALPPAARPHVRFAVAWRLLQDEPPGPDLELDLLVDRAEAALAQREPLPDQGGYLSPATIVQTRHSWNGSGVGERAISAAWCMGSTRRATHAAPSLDMRLAMLEALARQPVPPSADAFLALAGSEELEILRWTGARLGAILDPERAQSLGETLARDETPLVMGRLRKREVQ